MKSRKWNKETFGNIIMEKKMELKMALLQQHIIEEGIAHHNKK